MSAKRKDTPKKGHKDTTTLTRKDGWRLAVALVALIIAGCTPAPGTDNCFYVLIPYAATYVALALCVSMLLKAVNGPSPRDKGDVGTFVEKLQLRSMAGVVLAIATALGEVIFVVLNGTRGGFGYSLPASQAAAGPSRLPWMFAFLLLMAVTALCFADLRRRALADRL